MFRNFFNRSIAHRAENADNIIPNNTALPMFERLENRQLMSAHGHSVVDYAPGYTPSSILVDIGIKGHRGHTASAPRSAVALAYVLVKFDQKSANTINNLAGVQLVSPDLQYSAYYSPSATQQNKADVYVSIGGWTLSGSGSVSQTTSESGKISMQKCALFMGDAGLLLKSRISMTFTTFY